MVPRLLSPSNPQQHLPPHAPDRRRPNGPRNPSFIPPLTLVHPINIDLDLPPVTTLPSVQRPPVPMHQRFNRPATTFGGVPLSPMSMRLCFKRRLVPGFCLLSRYLYPSDKASGKFLGLLCLNNPFPDLGQHWAIEPKGMGCASPS
jgi:hypothetical protein